MTSENSYNTKENIQVDKVLTLSPPKTTFASYDWLLLDMLCCDWQLQHGRLEGYKFMPQLVHLYTLYNTEFIKRILDDFQTANDWVSYTGYGIHGYDIGYLGLNVEECKIACLETINCIGFVGVTGGGIGCIRFE